MTESKKMTDISWEIIDTYFRSNPNNLVAHHLESYNDFFSKGIFNIFKENGQIQFIEKNYAGSGAGGTGAGATQKGGGRRGISDDKWDSNAEFEEQNEYNGEGGAPRGRGAAQKDKDKEKQATTKSTKNLTAENTNKCTLYLGGKNGDRLYFGKPVIYDDQQAHYMYPNMARLRNMSYGVTIHYDVEVEFDVYDAETNTRQQFTNILEKIYLGRFPIMLQSNLCILQSLTRESRFNMGECLNDYGGYFIIDGKEKAIVSQEKFSDNMMYIRANKPDDIYTHSAEIRSKSEDTSKPIRTTAVKIMAPSGRLTNQQIVVLVPNVRKAVPLFILMRALGLNTDKEIIKTCLLDLEKNAPMVDLFIPSVHDAGRIYNQETAIRWIASFTKRGSVAGTFEILSNYLLPHIGELNFKDKAYFIGLMVYRLLKVYLKEELPTDRDNFRFKRVELAGTLMYELFREYFLIQKRGIYLNIDEKYYYHRGEYENDFVSLITKNVGDIFSSRDIETGFRKAFKGNWGSQTNTKRVGVVQDLNRLSWNTFISHLRKINLPLDASAKVVGPRLLNSSQWGFIDPLDTPDGANIGLHKHLSIMTRVTSGTSAAELIHWIRGNTSIKDLTECFAEYLLETTKVFVNGNWIGNIENALLFVERMKLYRRNGVIPIYTSISLDFEKNEIHLYSDPGRLIRPIYYFHMGSTTPCFNRENVMNLFRENKITWQQIISGLKAKPEGFNVAAGILYDLNQLYPDLANEPSSKIFTELTENAAVIDYIDTAEEESSLIATTEEDFLFKGQGQGQGEDIYGKVSVARKENEAEIQKYISKNNIKFTHIEVEPSLILGVMGNQIIFPENNPIARNAFSCGQSKQAVSVYHTNYRVRMDKMGVVLNYGQIPLIKSRYMDYINHEEQPYGVNAIVAIMCYTGYNVEDAILINEGAIKRGLFRTTYYTTYVEKEESSKVNGLFNSKFANIEKNNVTGIKPGYDYSLLDDNGMIHENTEVNDKTVLIGKIISNAEYRPVGGDGGDGGENGGSPAPWIDASATPKKGQLGFIDKSFITQNEEGFNIAKVRIREERIPAIGDKMASRSGQKGTIGLIIPEEDMPFTENGVRPDLIINPHAIPSRMTIGQIIESFFGKLCLSLGGFGDCTAFRAKGMHYDTYAPHLVKSGFSYTGNELLYNGMNGEQIESDIYMGPTYYMRLKHMVKDKVNSRALGPRTQLTRQTVQGRANDGGLRLGEMERDGIISHGMSGFLDDSYLKRGDEYYMAVCNKTGMVSIYNESQNLFLSPFADGPIQFAQVNSSTNTVGNMNVKNISRFGRDFSIVRVPYSLKLLLQELQPMGVQTRIITADNIDQLENLSYSNNINTLLNTEHPNDINEALKIYHEYITKELSNNKSLKSPEYYAKLIENAKLTPESPEYAPESPQYAPESPQYAPYSGNPESPYSGDPQYAPESPQYAPESPQYVPEYAGGGGGIPSASYQQHEQPIILINPKIIKSGGGGDGIENKIDDDGFMIIQPETKIVNNTSENIPDILIINNKNDDNKNDDGDNNNNDNNDNNDNNSNMKNRYLN